MLFKSLMLVGLLSNVAANNLRDNKEEIASVEHLDLEITHADGKRELFPLLPGTKCPPGHTCRARAFEDLTNIAGMTPMGAALKNNLKQPLAMAMNWEELNTNLEQVVTSDSYCTRRAAMKRAAGMAAGLAAAAVAQPAYAAATADVKMGSDAGLLAFVPAKTSICKGDSVKWTNNKGGPHNVVFDEDGVPGGVDAEKISQAEQMGDEGDTFTMAFSTAGEYNYYCEPHRGAGMQGVLIVA